MFVCAPSISGVTQSKQERSFVSLFPNNVPIELKIKKDKEASFKDLKNQKWASEFELEILNIGDRPIYYLHLDLFTDFYINGESKVLKA
jgi:hypothetical protein